MGRADLDEAVRGILGQYAKLARPAAQLDRSEDLFEAGMDSAAVVNVMLGLEDLFEFEFPEDRLTRASFRTIAAIVDIVDQAGAAA